MLELYHQEKPGLGAAQLRRSVEAITHECRNITDVKRYVKLGHKTLCGMICTAIRSGLTDQEVIEHLKVQNLETTIECVRTLRRDLRKAGYAVMTNTQVVALRGAF